MKTTKSLTEPNSTLFFQGIYEGLPATGWLTEGEARLLWDTVNLTEGPILEVGCYHGRSTVLLAATGREVCAVDPFDNFDSDHNGDYVEACLVDNLRSRSINNVRIYRERIEDWQTKKVGFAYLDGDHTNKGTKAQIVKALECSPSYIAVHDVNDSGGGLEVKKACISLLGKWVVRVERLAVWEIKC